MTTNESLQLTLTGVMTHAQVKVCSIGSLVVIRHTAHTVGPSHYAYTDLLT